MQRFLDAIQTHTYTGLRDRALAEVLCASGMRIAEALALNSEQIDWEAREARIIGKGNKQRTIYFTDTVLEWLHRYLQLRHDTHAAVFITQGDPPIRLRAQGTWKRFHRYALRAGLKKRVYPHMLRHTMATTLLSNGCPIEISAPYLDMNISRRLADIISGSLQRRMSELRVQNISRMK